MILYLGNSNYIFVELDIVPNHFGVPSFSYPNVVPMLFFSFLFCVSRIADLA